MQMNFWVMLIPIVAIEFGRRSLAPEKRPSFSEMEKACKSLKGKRKEENLAKAA